MSNIEHIWAKMHPPTLTFVLKDDEKRLQKGALEFTIIYNRVSSTLGEYSPQILGGVKADGGEEASDFFDGGG